MKFYQQLFVLNDGARCLHRYNQRFCYQYHQYNFLQHLDLHWEYGSVSVEKSILSTVDPVELGPPPAKYPVLNAPRVPTDGL